MKSGSNRFKASASASYFRHCSISKNWRLSVSFLAEALDLISISLRRNFTYALFAADVRAEMCSRWWWRQSRRRWSILTVRARQRRRIQSGQNVARARRWRGWRSRWASLSKNDNDWFDICHRLIWQFGWRSDSWLELTCWFERIRMSIRNARKSSLLRLSRNKKRESRKFQFELKFDRLIAC